MSDTVLLAVISTVGTVLTAAVAAFSAYMATAAKRQSSQTHLAINSRMDELLAAAKLLARAEGLAEGIRQGKTKPQKP